MKPSKSLSYLTSSLTSLTPAARARTLSVRFVSRHATTSTERRTVGAPTAVDGGIRRRGLSGVSLGNGPRLGRAAKDTSGSSSVSEERGTKGETGAPKAPGRGFHSQASYGLVGDPGAGTTGPLGDLASSSVDFLPLANKSSLPPPPHSNSATSSTSYVPSSTSTPTQSVPPPEGAVLLTRTGPTFSAPSLPSYFGGTSLSTVRRSNLVLRNGAYGIPKASLGFEGKGKGKMLNGVPERETREGDCPHSVGIGEDAYFLRSDALGVADGVGGWSGHAGANPARWSRKLMQHCSAELARYDNIEDEMFLQYYEVDPIVVLQRAFEVSIAECKEEGVIGSSTALLAVLRNDELRVANMGDCCCSIIRGSEYIFRSEEQQHSFNFPVQAGTNSKDTPVKDAQRFNIKVQKDDIVILSSDGLVDNLFDEDILEEVLRFVGSSPPPPAPPVTSTNPPRFSLNRFSPEVVSEALCLRAKSVYEDPRAVSSPFQQRAMEEGIHFAGGKRDDITILIGIVGDIV